MAANPGTYRVDIGNGSIRVPIAIGDPEAMADAALFKVRSWFSEFDPRKITNARPEGDDDWKDNKIPFIAGPGQLDDYRTAIIGRSGLSEGWSRDVDEGQFDAFVSGNNSGNGSGPEVIRGVDELDSPLSLAGMSTGSGQLASYLRDLDRRGITGGYGRQIQERNYAPAQSAFFGEGALSGLRNTGTANYVAPTFEDFLSSSPTLNMRGRARDAFTSLANYVQPNAAYSPEQQVAISEYTNPDPDSQRNIFSNLSNLASEAARSSFNPLIGNQMFRSDRFTPDMLQAQFMGQQGTANPSIGGEGFSPGQGNFVDFLRTRFGL